MEDINKRIDELEAKISELPVGYISKKMISGKERYYQQWTEFGKLKSKYIKNEDFEEFQSKILLRKKLQNELNELKSSAAFVERPKIQDCDFNTRVVYGSELKEFAAQSKHFSKRNCYSNINKYIYGDTIDKVCIVYGLRRTGKTTMLRQCLYDMKDSDFERSVYIKVTSSDTMEKLTKDLKRLYELGIRFAFIDEVTLLNDFIDSASILSDIYSAIGMKIVLSGTDSLGFWLASHEELYDRAVMIHTTYIPFSEHSRLLGINDVDEYIQYGGTLKAGVWDFDNEELNTEEACFRDNESTRVYIDTAICSNIQHSLKCYDGGEHFRHLFELYQNKELTGAINRIIEDESHKFLVDVLTREFESHDLHRTAKVLRKSRDESQRIELLDKVNEKSVTEILMEILEIKNSADYKTTITEDHVNEIKEYLKALDLLDKVDVNAIGRTLKVSENELFVQPGMRFCQAKALVHSVIKDSKFEGLNREEKDLIMKKILEVVIGQMLEDIVLLDTKRRYGKTRDVFKLYFAVGEFDMVIFNPKTYECECFEIKHSDEIVEVQAKHLLDEEKIAATEKKFGKVIRRCVLYKGGSGIASNGIEYKNVEEFLCC